MERYTYESGKVTKKLETYEWDDIWFEHAPDEEGKRVLYIGDSISCGTRRIATAQTENTIYFDGFGTSKALDNPYLLEGLSLMLKQEPHLDAIIFNNGLHGWHLDDETEYKEYYQKTIKTLREWSENVPVFVVLTTSLMNETRDIRVKKRNEIAKEIAKTLDFPVIDLYTVSAENKHFMSADGVHFTEEGYALLAKTIIDALKASVAGLK